MTAELTSVGLERWPRLRRGLVIATTPDGLLLEGGPSPQLMRGTAATSVLPHLLPRLDGEHGPEEICAALPLSRGQLGQALDLLGECGLLEWVLPDAPAGFSAEHVATYMSRTVSVTGSCPSANDLAATLAGAIVVLVAPPVLAEPIAADLKETGVGTVRVCDQADLTELPLQPAERHVAAVFDDPMDADVLVTAVAACREYDVPVLRFGLTDGCAEVGPFFCGIETACLSCYRRGRVDEAHAPATSWSAEAGPAGILAGLVTSALLGVLTGQPPVPSPRQLVMTMIPSLVSETRDVVPELDCQRCVGGSPPQDPAARALLAYEWQMAKRSPRFEPRSAGTPAERDRLDELQWQRDSFPTSPRLRLPDQPCATEAEGCLSASVLAAVLARTAGYRSSADPRRGRWAPSGGNMASVGLYLCTEADLFPLPGTIYRYDDTGHQLLSVRADPVPLERILEGTGLEHLGADIAIVFIGATGRLRQKYGDFAWRLAHLDAGCAALQLQLAATRFGLRVTFAAAWPAGLPDILELEVDREVVTAVAGLAAEPGGHVEGPSPCR